MLKLFILSLVILIFFSISLVLKMLIKGEENINGADCSGNKSSNPSACSLCKQRTEGACSVKLENTGL
jgi:hypothetical protein